MTTAITDRDREICKENGWGVYEEYHWFEIGIHSPLGEHFVASMRTDCGFKTLGDMVTDYAERFDAQEHAAMWHENDDRTSLNELLADAEKIQEWLLDLAKALKEED